MNLMYQLLKSWCKKKILSMDCNMYLKISYDLCSDAIVFFIKSKLHISQLNRPCCLLICTFRSPLREKSIITNWTREGLFPLHESELHVERLNDFKLLVAPITSGTFAFSFSFIDKLYMSFQCAFVVITSITNMA